MMFPLDICCVGHGSCWYFENCTGMLFFICQVGLTFYIQDLNNVVTELLRDSCKCRAWNQSFAVLRY